MFEWLKKSHRSQATLKEAALTTTGFWFSLAQLDLSFSPMWAGYINSLYIEETELASCWHSLSVQVLAKSAITSMSAFQVSTIELFLKEVYTSYQDLFRKTYDIEIASLPPINSSFITSAPQIDDQTIVKKLLGVFYFDVLTTPPDFNFAFLQKLLLKKIEVSAVKMPVILRNL